MSYTIHEASLSDLPQIKEIYHLTTQANPNNLYYHSIDLVTDEVIAKKINYNKDGVALVVKKDGVVVAFGCGKRKDSFRTKHTMDSCTLIIHPEHRKATLGTVLAKAFFEKCRERLFRYVWTEYPATNAKSIKMRLLFLKMGFYHQTITIPSGVFLTTGKQVDLVYTIFDLEKTQDKNSLKSHILLFFASPYAYIVSQVLWRVCKNTILKKHPKAIKLIEGFCTKNKKTINAILAAYILFIIGKIISKTFF